MYTRQSTQMTFVIVKTSMLPFLFSFLRVAALVFIKGCTDPAQKESGIFSE